MHEASFDAGDGEAFEVTAGFAEPQTAQAHLADLEFLADQVIEGDPGRDQVPASLARRDLDLIVSSQGGDGFFLDESHLAIRLSRLAEGAALLVITIAFEAEARDGTGLVDGPEPGGPTRTACAKSETGPRTPESQIFQTYFPHHFNHLPLQPPASLPTASYTGGEERLAVIRNPNRRTTTETTGDQPVRLTQPPCTAARPPRSKESSQFSAKPRQILPNLAKFHQIGRPAARQCPTAGISGQKREK